MRRQLLNKLKHKCNIEIESRLFDKFYYWWQEETKYPLSKINGIEELMYDKRMFNSFSEKLKHYIEITK